MNLLTQVRLFHLEMNPDQFRVQGAYRIEAKRTSGGISGRGQTALTYRTRPIGRAARHRMINTETCFTPTVILLTTQAKVRIRIPIYILATVRGTSRHFAILKIATGCLCRESCQGILPFRSEITFGIVILAGGWLG